MRFQDPDREAEREAATKDLKFQPHAQGAKMDARYNAVLSHGVPEDQVQELMAISKASGRSVNWGALLTAVEKDGPEIVAIIIDIIGAAQTPAA